MRLVLIFILFFLGCSNKDVFVPKTTKTLKLKSKPSKELVDYTKNSLTFRELHLKYSKTDVKGEWVYYDENNKKLGKFIKINKNLAKKGDKLLILDKNKTIKLPALIASATQNNNLIAIVFENNAEGIYDLDKKRLIFYQENSPVIITKYLKASPLFYDNLVFFPLLNSKVSIYDLNTNSFLRNIDLSDESIINNIIFLKVVNNSLIIATPHKVIVFNPHYLIDYKSDIKHVIDLNGYIYSFEVGGKIVKLDTKLKKLKEINLPFADFFAPSVCKNSIYTIANNYLIKISPDLNITVFSGNNFDLNEPLIIKRCKIYNSDKVYLIE